MFAFGNRKTVFPLRFLLCLLFCVSFYPPLFVCFFLNLSFSVDVFLNLFFSVCLLLNDSISVSIWISLAQSVSFSISPSLSVNSSISLSLYVSFPVSHFFITYYVIICIFVLRTASINICEHWYCNRIYETIFINIQSNTDPRSHILE